MISFDQKSQNTPEKATKEDADKTSENARNPEKSQDNEASSSNASKVDENRPKTESQPEVKAVKPEEEWYDVALVKAQKSDTKFVQYEIKGYFVPATENAKV